MSHGVLSFQRRAARVLASDQAPALEVLDELITDGCAEALALETEMRRLERRREAAIADVDDRASAHLAVRLGHERDEVGERLDAVHDAVRALMGRRSRLRLRAFLADR